MPPVTGRRRDSRAKILGIDALELDREQLGPIDDLQMQIADAIVAADDIEVHVAGDVFEFVAEELKVARGWRRRRRRGSAYRGRGGRRRGESGFRLRPARRSRWCWRGQAARSRRPVRVCGFAGQLASGGKPTTSKLHAAWPGLFAEGDPLEPEAEDIAREDREDDERSDERDGGRNRSDERAAIEEVGDMDVGDRLRRPPRWFRRYEMRVIRGCVRGGGCDIDGGDDVILQRGKAALQQHGGGRIGDRHEYAAEQVAVADEERDAADGNQADAASGWRRFEEPIPGHAEPEREAERRRRASRGLRPRRTRGSGGARRRACCGRRA